MILPFRWMKNFSSKWLKELENVESGHPHDGCTTVTIPNSRMDKFSPPDVLAPAACHLLRLPPQLPGQLAQIFTIADYLHRVFVCQCCLLELSYQKCQHLHLIRSSTSASQESALAKSPLTTLSSLSKEFLILPFDFCCLKFWLRKWNSETLRYFFRDPDFWISILERKTTLRYIWQHLTKFPFQLLTMFFYRTQVWS